MTPEPSVGPSPSSLPSEGRLVLVAGGDVDFGRLRGQALLRDPMRDDLAPLRPLFDSADVRFANLESTITDQGGETQAPWSRLVFTAPPAAARVLAGAGIDLVSLANNHAWDYGEAGLFETFERLERAGVAWVGAGRNRDEAYRPSAIDRRGQRMAFIAVTGIWNQALDPHPGEERIANADGDALGKAIRSVRSAPDVDRVVVSFHGGDEYVDRPLPRVRALLTGALDAGADAVIGHHPHVIQRVEIHDGKPILYSLGNLLMRMPNGEPWTEYGLVARLTFERRGPIDVEVCPLRTSGLDVVPLAADPERSFHEAYFRHRFEQLLRDGAAVDPQSSVTLARFGVDGCAKVTAGR